MDKAACESAGSACTVELKEAPSTPVGSCDVLLGLVFLHRGFGELAAQFERLAHVAGGGVERSGDFFFSE
ncbi:hypothetical protein [Glutamicibacter sp. X7]